MFNWFVDLVVLMELAVDFETVDVLVDWELATLCVSLLWESVVEWLCGTVCFVGFVLLL